MSPRPSTDPWSALVRAILFQQLAGAAASSIQRKWYGFYGDEASTPTPEQVLATSDEDFRACGISRQKMSYFRDLALHTSDGRLKFSRHNRMSDEDVIKALTAVKGVGEWTAHMHLMFHLDAPTSCRSAIWASAKGCSSRTDSPRCQPPSQQSGLARSGRPTAP